MITYTVGNAIIPLKYPTVIVHCCNDIGAWGAGFVVALGDKYPRSKSKYREMFNHHPESMKDDLFREVKMELGQVQIVQVEADVFVANLIGQHGIRFGKSDPPIRYWAVRQGLSTVYKLAKEKNWNVQMPMIGAGLAGGNWNTLESIIDEEFPDIEVNVILLSETLEWTKIEKPKHEPLTSEQIQEALASFPIVKRVSSTTLADSLSSIKPKKTMNKRGAFSRKK